MDQAQNSETVQASDTKLTQQVIEKLNLESLVKLCYYNPSYKSQYYAPYEDLAKTLSSYLEPFVNLQKPTYPFTCFTDLKNILKDVFELHDSHPNANYTNKLNSVILQFTELQIKYSDNEGEDSLNSRKCNHIIALCKEIKRQRDRFCRPYTHNRQAYVIE